MRPIIASCNSERLISDSIGFELGKLTSHFLNYGKSRRIDTIFASVEADSVEQNSEPIIGLVMLSQIIRDTN